MTDTPKCDAAIKRLQSAANTPTDWADQVAKRHQARSRWLQVATSDNPLTLMLASAESDLREAGGDDCDMRLLRQRAREVAQ